MRLEDLSPARLDVLQPQFRKWPRDEELPRLQEIEGKMENKKYKIISFWVNNTITHQIH